MNTKSETTIEAIKRLKSIDSDTIILFHIGDFYEIFGDDAETVSRILDLTITTRRNARTGDSLKMTGFPVFFGDSYIPKIVATGKRVAIVDRTK